MTQDEIIEIVREAGGSDVGGHGWTTWVGTQSTEFLERFANLVAAKEREALAQPEPVPPPWWPAVENILNEYGLQAIDFVADFKNAMAQPEQEPVAWLSTDNIGERHLCFDKPLDNDPVQPLYTTPPQRTQPNDIDFFWRAATTPEKWVRLTAEEVLQCWEKAHEPGNKEHINAIRMADEVEQALKEKNCG